MMDFHQPHRSFSTSEHGIPESRRGHENSSGHWPENGVFSLVLLESRTVMKGAQQLVFHRIFLDA